MIRNATLPISCWAAEDIPSNKAVNLGFDSLSNSELLSIIIGSGTTDENAIELCRKVLVANNNSLKKLGKMRFSDLTGINGIGRIKASKILASIEIGRRMNQETPEDLPDISTATRIYNYMYPRIGDRDCEEFWALYMNQHYRLVQAKRISVGGISETAVDIRVIIREAVLCNATCLAVCHNHPSGKVSPSTYDDNLTISIKRACEVMRLFFMDHVIVVDGMYYSYHELGRL